MPTSSGVGKSEIKQWFDDQGDIKTIVDFGCGEGTYVKLLGKDKYRWVGIDIWEDYVKRYDLNNLYDEIIIGDIRDVKLPEGDCAIFGDILEHMTKDDVVSLLGKVSSFYKHIVISLPINYTRQTDAFMGNEYEKHLAIWDFEEFSKLLTEDFKVRKLIKYMGIFIK
ncbi:MAG: class I SAM-dependent methyltransferase [Candidatus Levybacteria bacterium]|nr:class I SAM-dependent methyltransferase [Candidatus Levybacteria bacterium]